MNADSYVWTITAVNSFDRWTIIAAEPVEAIRLWATVAPNERLKELKRGERVDADWTAEWSVTVPDEPAGEAGP